jgi:phosphoserine phosphatase RsbU/P
MTLRASRILESKFLHAILIAAGGLLLTLAILQLPITVFYQNTRPGMPFQTVRMTEQGTVVDVPSGLSEEQTPFRRGDVITRIDEFYLDSVRRSEWKVTDRISRLRLGDTLHVRILRDGRAMNLIAPLNHTRAATSGRYVSALIYLYNVVSPILSVLIALIIIIRRPRKRESVLFFLFSWCISLVLLLSHTLAHFMPWWRLTIEYNRYIMDAAWVLFFPALLHFLLIFPEERFLRRTRWLRNLIVYTPFILYAVVEYTARYAFKLEINRTMLWADYIVYAVLPFAGIAILVSSLRRATTPVSRKAILTVLWGFACYAIGNAVNGAQKVIHYDTFLPAGWTDFVVMGSILLLSFSLPLSFGYAILRYGFLDVQVIFKRTTLYAVLAGIVTVFFIALYALLRLSSDALSSVEVMFVSVIVTGVIAISLSMVKDRIEHALDKRVFREEYRVNTALHELSRGMLHFLDRESLLAALTRDLPAILKLNSACVMALDESGEIARLAGNDVPVKHLAYLAAMPAFKAGLRGDVPIVVNALPGAVYNRELHVAFTIASGNGQYIAVLLGEKTSGRPLTSDELDLLRTVADHAALGWKNADMTEEMKAQERIKKEIEIAQTIQAAMLPASTPEIPGYDLAASSTPAREVGGDFFDFLNRSDRAFGIVLGDVSDKGISAAMVMASAISTLRFAAEEETAPRDILGRANSRLFRDTHRHMFVAVFFGMLDPKTDVLTFTNAGLPKPLLFRGDDSFVIDWSDNGKHFPLGTQQEVEFHQQSLQLEAGDILVLYTDGVMEARDVNDEEFGVKRLRDVVRARADCTAEEIRKAVCEQIAAFTGKTELFDDLTLIVLKVVQ